MIGLSDLPPMLGQEQETYCVEVIPNVFSGEQRAVLMALFRAAALPPNWDGYGSPRLDKKAVNRAAETVRAIDLESMESPAVMPLAGGGVQLEFVENDRELHLCFFPEGTTEYLKIQNRQALDEGPITSIRDVQTLVTWLVA